MKITIELDNRQLLDRILAFCASLNVKNVKVSEGKTERKERNEQIMRVLKEQLLEHLDIPIIKLVLFGSQVYGEPHQDSDYDVLLVVEQEVDFGLRNKVLSIISDVEMKYDIFIDLKILSKGDLETPFGKQLVYEEALEKGIEI